MSGTDITALLRALGNLFAEGNEPGTADAAALLAGASARVSGALTAVPFAAMTAMRAHDAHPAMASLVPVLAALPWYAPGAEDGRIPEEVHKGLRTCTLFGPGELVECARIRGGLFAQDRNVPYGSRRHAAVELFVTIAGAADWTCDGITCHRVGPGGRIFHPTFADHATATPDKAVLAAWLWSGDIAYDSYDYAG